MKIAIKADPKRGKEILSLLESFGGVKKGLSGDGIFHTYYVDKNNTIRYDTPPVDYKVYTLEEFEEEFPFKVGDVVQTSPHGEPAEVVKMYQNSACGIAYKVRYRSGVELQHCPENLKFYKEMKEERNITLTFDKAKEWYNKGGELKEIALQAFTEKELNPLPRSWEEYGMKYGCVCLSTRYTNIPLKYDALFKLEQLRDCWRQGNIPRGLKYKIRKTENKYTVLWGPEDAFLSFCDKQTAEEFLKCFRDLIEEAGDLI